MQRLKDLQLGQKGYIKRGALCRSPGCLAKVVKDARADGGIGISVIKACELHQRADSTITYYGDPGLLMKAYSLIIIFK